MSKLDKERYERENKEWKLNIMLKESGDAEAARVEALPEYITSNSESAKVIVNSPITSSPSDQWKETGDFAGVCLPCLPFKTTPGTPHSLSLYCDTNPPAAATNKPFPFCTTISFQGIRKDQSVTPDNTRTILQSEVDTSQVRFAPRHPVEDLTGEMMCKPATATVKRDFTALFAGDSSQNMPRNGRRFYPVDVTYSSATFYGEMFQGEPFRFNRNHEDEPTYPSGHNDNIQGAKDEDPRYMRGYIQGFKVAPGLAAKGRRFSYVDSNPNSFTDQDGETAMADFVGYNQNWDAAYMRGYIEGFKNASEMCMRGWKENLPEV
jgi:hypothetical protein